MKFHVQKIRSCVQCGDVLAKTCDRCKSHPERKPRVITYFDWPEILGVCPCNCSVLIRCQRPRCESEPFYRERKHNRGGLAKSAGLYCSRQCNLAVIAAQRDRKVTVVCACGCGTKVTRKPSGLSPLTFARPDHYFTWRKRTAFNTRQVAAASKRAAANAADVGLYFCAKCNDITEHDTPERAPAKCKICGTRSNPLLTSMGIGETQRLVLAERSVKTVGA